MIRQLTAICLLLVGSWAHADFTGKITSVKDGDTLVMGSKVIRLWLADCPEIAHHASETDQPYGPEAKAWVEKRVIGKSGKVIEHGSSYGRTVGEVIIGGKSLNRGLLVAGLAEVDTRYGKNKLYLADQADAQSNHRGLWGEENPIAPWDWRHRKAVVADSDPWGVRAQNRRTRK